MEKNFDVISLKIDVDDLYLRRSNEGLKLYCLARIANIYAITAHTQQFCGGIAQ